MSDAPELDGTFPPHPDPPDPEPVESDPLDEFRNAAGAVIASLKRLAEAAEQVVDDPETFARVTAGGRAVVEAFLGGFAAQSDPADDDDPPQA